MSKRLMVLIVFFSLLWLPYFQALSDTIYEASSGLFPDESCPPWNLSDNAAPEDPSLSGGKLIISTSEDAENIFYKQSAPDIVVPDPLIIEARVKFVSGSTSVPYRAPIFIAFSISPNVGNALFIGADEIFINSDNLVKGDSAVVDTNDAFHTYRIEVSSTGSIEVFYDNVLTLSGSTFESVPFNGGVERLSWGEGSISAFGNSEWKFFKHNASTVKCADLTLTKTDSPDPVTAGSTLTYTLSVTNNGPDDATDVTLTDTLPAGVTFDSATPDQGTCNEAGGIVTCDLGTIANGASVDVTIEVTVDSSTINILTNMAEVEGNEIDPDDTNNSASEDTNVNTEADLSVAKTDDPDPVIAGNSLTYTVTVTNNGPSDATGVELTDTLPAGVTFALGTPDQGTCNEAGGIVTCDLGTIVNGASVDVTIEVTVDSSTINTLTNNASVTTTIIDPNAANNTVDEDTTVTTEADLSVAKTDDFDPVIAGDTTLNYTVTVTNNGPSDATGVELTDTLPGGVTFVSATPDQGTCNEASGTITCDLGTIQNGASSTVTIEVTIDASTTGILTNMAEVDSNETDPDTNNNTVDEDTAVATEADLSVAKTDDPDPIIAGSSLTYTVTVTNNGPSDSTGVELVDTLPAGVTFDSATPDQGTCNEAGGIVTCDLGTIQNGASTIVIIEVTVDASTTGTLTNTATVDSNETDPNTADTATNITGTNNTATENTTVIAAFEGLISSGPNPVNAIVTFYIKSPTTGANLALSEKSTPISNATLYIFDMTGALVHRESLDLDEGDSGEVLLVEWNTSKLPNGVYLYLVIFENETLSEIEKLIIQHE